MSCWRSFKFFIDAGKLPENRLLFNRRLYSLTACPMAGDIAPRKLFPPKSLIKSDWITEFEHRRNGIQYIDHKTYRNSCDGNDQIKDGTFPSIRLLAKRLNMLICILIGCQSLCVRKLKEYKLNRICRFLSLLNDAGMVLLS